MFSGSWRTTAVGIFTGLGILAVQLVAILDTDPATVFSTQEALAGLGLVTLGWFSRDNKISSERAGAK